MLVNLALPAWDRGDAQQWLLRRYGQLWLRRPIGLRVLTEVLVRRATKLDVVFLDDRTFLL